jgi:phage protein D
MTAIALHDTGQALYVPAFTVEMNDAPMTPKVVRDVMEVTFEDSVDKIDSFTFTFNNFDADTRRQKFVGDGATDALWSKVQPGTRIRLSMGYQGRRPDFRVMTTGFITTLDADFPEAGTSRLTVRGLNVLDRFRLKQYTWSWPPDGNGTVRDSEVARDLGGPPDSPDGKPGLPVKVRISDEALAKERPQAHVFMNNQYPIVFLMQLARRNGYDLFITADDAGNEELFFGPSQRVSDRTYLLEWGKSLTAMKASISTTKQVKKVVVLGWDRAKKAPIHGEATVEKDLDPRTSLTVRSLASANGRDEIVTDYVVADEQAANDKAKLLLNHVASSLIQVEVTTVGLPDLRAGRTVQIGRVGTQLNGTYFITESRHIINDSGYRTTFKARMEGPQEAPR